MPTDAKESRPAPDRGHTYKQVAADWKTSERTIIRLCETGELERTYIAPRLPRIFDSQKARYLAKRGLQGAE